MENKTEAIYFLARDFPLTKDERAELELAKMMPIIFDGDCPETTPERALRFRRVNPLRRANEDHNAKNRLH